VYYLGIDIGSVSTNFVLIDEKMKVHEKLYIRTKGMPINAVQEGLKILKKKYRSEQIKGLGTTGSGRKVIGFLLGSDIVKNEITTHAVAALNVNKDVKTIFEIGGQDSKIIIIENGIVTDFDMNTVCAAGTGSFLDRQAERLGIPIEEFGNLALKADMGVQIAGRCAVFAESDMIHKQQMGYDTSVIIKGLCEALVRNYINNIAKRKKILEPIFFQGGVAANKGMIKAFEKETGKKIIVPEHYNVMGALGACIIAKEYIQKTKNKTNFRGFNLYEAQFKTESFECDKCSNGCEVISMYEDGIIIGYFGDRCGRWENQNRDILSEEKKKVL